MRSKRIAVWLLAAVGICVGLTGCVDKELAASALNHRWAMEKALAKAEAATDPDEVAKATEEANEARELFEAVTTGEDGAKILEAIEGKECP